MERNTDIWDALPDSLLWLILSRLPVRDFGSMSNVCKRWKNMLPPGDSLQRIDPNFSVNSIPAFLVQLSWGWGWDSRQQETWVIELGHGGGSDINIHKSPSPNGLIIVDACKSIYLCKKNEDMLNLCLFNPATGTRRNLPRLSYFSPYWAFNAMTFDATLRRCTVLLGQINVEERTGNLMVLQIYDSESNAWTRVSMTVPFFIRPHGKGFYSNRKFYWLMACDAMYVMAAFDIAESSWTQIILPEVCRSIRPYPAFLYLSGSDGRLLLILQGEKRGSIRMWRLNDFRGAAEWHELHDICIPECHKIYSVVVNNGWVMMVDNELEVYLCNLERKSTQKISLPGQLRSDMKFLQWFLLAFEYNNVWWP